jgi:hypothetical protein
MFSKTSLLTIFLSIQYSSIWNLDFKWNENIYWFFVFKSLAWLMHYKYLKIIDQSTVIVLNTENFPLERAIPLLGTGGSRL